MMKKVSVVAVMVGLCILFGSMTAMAYDLKGIDIHGFASQGYLYSDENNFFTANTKDGTFAYNEVGINFSTQPIDDLRIGMQLFSRDLGEMGNNDITVDWALGDYRVKDWLGIRAGKIKRPLGLYNDVRDADMARTVIFLPQGIYPEIQRDVINAIQGAELYGNLPLSSAGDSGRFP